MLNTAQRISEASLARLHPGIVDAPDRIRAVLERARAERVELKSGVNEVLERETARVLSLGEDELRLSVEHLDRSQRTRLLLSLSLDGRDYTFSAPVLELAGSEIRVGMPRSLFVSERRDRLRVAPGAGPAVPRRMALEEAGRRHVEAEILDYSQDGAAVRVPAELSRELPERLHAVPLEGPDAGRVLRATVRSRADLAPGWQRLGLALRAAPSESLIAVEPAREPGTPERWLEGGRTLVLGARVAGHRAWRRIAPRREPPRLEVLRFEDARGEAICALVDRAGSGPGAPVVLMPPAFAKTKETLLPLARTIVATFAAAGEPVCVVRTDGIRRRGESHNDPGCNVQGCELHRYTYSQGVSDVHAALRFLRSDPRFATDRVVLVTFSSGSIEARRAIAEDRTGIVAGWISVVGAADLKSGWQVLSGGVDYIGGRERGVHFGIQKVLGIEGNIDLIAEDALEHGLAFIEDARRDMARIRVPITWLSGRYDAWIDRERVRDMLSCGDVARRRLVEVPTGHQLRTSSEAFATFRLVAEEAGRLLLGRKLRARDPDVIDLDLRAQTERARRPRPAFDPEGFWRSYLLGEGGGPGMDLLIETSSFRELLARQVRALDLRPGQRVADVGSGTGSFLDALARETATPRGIVVHELDFVADALLRARERFRRSGAGAGSLRADFVRADLDGKAQAGIPLATSSCDRLVASLVLNYVSDPARLLREMHRVLRPGGRMVLTSLRRDADVSRIYAEASAELRGGLARERFDLAAHQIEAAIGQFLNQVGRLLDLEESGVFATWGPDELASLVRKAGFRDLVLERVFGDPPQAVLIAAVKGR
jgi:ubiquinone/menaquinone biosynthesis C-methylase UbiE